MTAGLAVVAGAVLGLVLRALADRAPGRRSWVIGAVGAVVLGALTGWVQVRAGDAPVGSALSTALLTWAVSGPALLGLLAGPPRDWFGRWAIGATLALVAASAGVALGAVVAG